MTIPAINTDQIRRSVTGSKAIGVTKDFDSYMGAVEAMAPMGGAIAGTYGSTNAATVLGAAFSGVAQVNGLYGGGASAPMYSAGFGGGGYGAGFGAGGVSNPGLMGVGKYNSPGMPNGIPGGSGGDAVIPGTEGFSQWDMINTMNQNNLQLLQLQAAMQSNMQAWNTKSNILNADHQARRAIIEKFTGR